MGLFGNYNKPGPGVSKDERKKKGIALYFQLFFRHFWDFIKENMMYVLASLPMFLILYAGLTFLDIFGIMEWIQENNMWQGYEQIKWLFLVLFVILCGTGPASAGMAHMMRCITREEHCFLWSDFWEKFKENFKSSMIIAVMDVVLLLFIMPIAIRFYYMQYISTANTMWFVMLSLVLIICLLYVMMHMYFYQFAITFELKFKELIRNSWIMAIAYLPLNLIVMAIPVVLTFFLASYITPIFMIILILFFWISFMRYPLEFLAARLIYKKLVESKGMEEEAEETAEE